MKSPFELPETCTGDAGVYVDTMSEEATKKAIEDLLGPPTDISGIGADSKGPIMQAAFDLYRETAVVTIVSSHVFESKYPSDGIMDRDQAICAGLIVRISKFLRSVMTLLADNLQEHGDVILALNRCITESAINLKFFCEVGKEQDIEDFVKSSLKPEKEQYTIIQRNVSKRGETLPIELRMMNSIDRVLKLSGLEGFGALDSTPRRKDYRKILEAMGMESFYPSLQGIPSHAIHGTWVDLVLHHLEDTKNGFRPRPNSKAADVRLLCPVDVLVLMAIRSYISKYFTNKQEGVLAILDRINDLIERNNQVDSLHEEFLSRRRNH